MADIFQFMQLDIVLWPIKLLLQIRECSNEEEMYADKKWNNNKNDFFLLSNLKIEYGNK